nr:hypothetical protein HK105_006056 [Polyrhizophydium stewartii]
MRLQTTMKRNGISDTEAGATIYQTIDDQRVKQSELLEHYQRALQLRDDKIRHLHEQLSKLEGLLRYKGTQTNVVDSVDIQVAQSKPEMLRAAYESRIAQIKAMHRTTANALIEETRGLDDQFKAQFAAICQEARDASVLKRIGQTKFVILETAKLLFPSKPLMGIPCETQCDLDKGKF